jgi:branched-subunit amino acid aminotransferase/4-amino-4-deoxychorismate lyase
LKLADLQTADEVFITSSTRDLLPVLAVEGLSIQTGNRVWPRLNQAFKEFIGDYVSSRLAVRTGN